MIKSTLRQLMLSALILLSVSVWAQAPANYYNTALNKNKEALLEALHGIVGPHTTVSYSGLWDVYRESDLREDGTIWDMYSTCTFYPGQDQCGNYSSVGDCYNREHSFPKSWFNRSSPMVSDAFHIYPTDGKVNGQRSSYPYGECANGTTLSSKALGRLGYSTFPGYSGRVFEPVDQYKGDFARTYFYMAACYKNRISGWNSPMLAGNDYPCYTTWAINLLLKWSRQDPVSEKEINRNNAVEKYQHNRNPFIDHPELAEFIWGNNKNDAWQPGGVVNPEITAPNTGVNVNMGITTLNTQLTATIRVKASGLTKDLNLFLSNTTGFSLSSATLTKEQASAGVDVTVTYQSLTEATATSVLTINSDEVTAVTVNLSAQAVDGIPANPAQNVTMNSFKATWTNVSGNVNYNLSVSDNLGVLDGYPKTVAASDQNYVVTNLTPETQYHYQLTYENVTSNVVDVQTLTPTKVISFTLPSEGLHFAAAPGVAPAVKTVTLYTEYITEDVTVTVTAPFELSTDKATWSQNLTLDAAGEDFYIRIPAQQAGVYSGTLSASTATVAGIDVDVDANIAAPITFFEDFESITGISGYATGDFEGVVNWHFENVGVYGRSGDVFNGTMSACLGKDTDSSITMLEDKMNGVSTLSFMAARYGSDAEATIEVYYSVNQGNDWTLLGTEAIENSGLFKTFTYTINTNLPVRVKIQQLAGKRVNIDDIRMSDYSDGIENVTAKGFDAFVRQDKLVIETAQEEKVAIFTADAMQVFQGAVKGTHTISLAKGMYIVVCGDASKKIIIK